MAAMIDGAGRQTGRAACAGSMLEHLTDAREGDLADSEMLDPETPDEMFEFMPGEAWPFPAGGLLARARAR